MKTNILIAYILFTMGVLIINYNKPTNDEILFLAEVLLAPMLLTACLVFLRKNLRVTKAFITIIYILLVIASLATYLAIDPFFRSTGSYILLMGCIMVLQLASLYIKKLAKPFRNIALIYAVLVATWNMARLLWMGDIMMILLMGPLFLALYLAYRYKQDTPGTLKTIVLHFVMYAHPVLLTMSIFYYLTMPYRQTIILPKGYEGLVVIQYDEPQGAPKEYTGGFLGLGRSWLIKVDRNGWAKTQHKYSDRHIPILDASSWNNNYLEDAKIYYEGDLNTQIPVSNYSFNPTEDYRQTPENYRRTTEAAVSNNLKHDRPIAFLGYESILRNYFIVAKPGNYLKHFVLNPKRFESQEHEYIYNSRYSKTLDSLRAHDRYLDSLQHETVSRIKKINQ